MFLDFDLKVSIFDENYFVSLGFDEKRVDLKLNFLRENAFLREGLSNCLSSFFKILELAEES